MVHKRLVEIFRNDEMFADRAILLVGDLLQIPPTLQRAIYEEPIQMQNKALYNSDANLWSSCESVQLLVNKRQGNSEWRETLARIRFGEMNEDDIKILETRRVSNEEHKNKNLDDALHLFFSNKEVNAHNTKIINKLPGMPEVIKADIKGYPKGCYAAINDGFVEQTRFQQYLTLKKGARVIMNLNVDISDALVNGIVGTVIAYDIRTPLKTKQHLGHGARIYAVIIKFDDPDVGQNLRKMSRNFNLNNNTMRLIKEENAVPIFRQTMSINPERFSSSTSCSVEQFPLNLFYASTSHKIQGRTLTTDVVCYSHQYMKAGCGYVMLSRNTKLENVYISADFDFEKVYPHKKSLQVTKKLVKNDIAAKLKEKTFQIFYVNMRGKSNLINVQHDPFAIQSNLICLVETNMNSSEMLQWPAKNGFPGKKCFPLASSGRGTGVCAFANQTQEKPPYEYVARKISKRYQILQLRMQEFTKIDFQDIVQDKYQIFILYVSQDADKKSIANDLQEMLLDDVDCIVLGDFNFDPSKTKDKADKALYHFLTDVLQLQQIVTGPTYVNGSNTIDHIYVPKNLADQFLESSRFNYYSDHLSFNICFE